MESEAVWTGTVRESSRDHYWLHHHCLHKLSVSYTTCDLFRYVTCMVTTCCEENIKSLLMLCWLERSGKQIVFMTRDMMQNVPYQIIHSWRRLVSPRLFLVRFIIFTSSLFSPLSLPLCPSLMHPSELA